MKYIPAFTVHFVALSVALASLVDCRAAQNQVAPAIYDEALVPAYTLPELLRNNDGSLVSTSDQWKLKRRAEILAQFEVYVYGCNPPRYSKISSEVLSEDPGALQGIATRRQVRIYLFGRKNGPFMDMLLYVPNRVSKPVPAFLGYNFGGNQAVHADPGILISDRWMRESRTPAVVNNRATESTRGTEAKQWQVEKLLANGFALATVYYGDVEPDHANGWKQGVRSALSLKGTNTVFKPHEWGAIGAWAWGLSRGLDYLEGVPDINAKKVAVIGHSRLGKTALWAGVQDQRFAAVISNNSGCGGAALNRRCIGETVHRINSSFPHWFCDNFKRFNALEHLLPVDQHMLIALVAPRPVYVASAEEDKWADPKGEFLSAKHAEPAYSLFGLTGLGYKEMPPVNCPVGNNIGYHIRTGKHDVTEYDWDQYIAFAKKHF